MRPITSLSLLIFVVLVLLLPLLFYQLMLAGLAKLHLSPGTALALMLFCVEIFGVIDASIPFIYFQF